MTRNSEPTRTLKIYLNISHTLLRVCEDEINWSYDCIQTDQDLKIDLVVGEGRKQRSGESGAGGRCQLHPGRWMSFTRSSLLNAQTILTNILECVLSKVLEERQ